MILRLLKGHQGLERDIKNRTQPNAHKRPDADADKDKDKEITTTTATQQMGAISCSLAEKHKKILPN